MIKRNKPGFTLTELMIAMGLFSFILLFAVNAFIQVNKIYVKGITTKRMNDQANLIIQDLSKNLQQEQSPVVCVAPQDASKACDPIDPITTSSETQPTNYICLPSQNMSYIWKVRDAGNFKKVTGNKCVADSQTSNEGSLIDSNTQVIAMNINKISVDGANSAWNLDLVLSTQRTDQLTRVDDDDPLTTRCKGDVSDQYCSVVHLTTLIRVNN